MQAYEKNTLTRKSNLARTRKDSSLHIWYVRAWTYAL